MRSKQRFWLATSKDASHAAGKGVRKTRREGKLDSINAKGDVCPLCIGFNKCWDSIITDFLEDELALLGRTKENPVIKKLYQAYPSFDSMSKHAHRTERAIMQKKRPLSHN